MEKYERVPQSRNLRRLVSVVVPIYSKSVLVLQTLESVLAQTYQDIELILVVDGQFPVDVDRHSIIGRADLVLELPHNGVSVARNAGFIAGRGDYYLFLDHDDILHPQMVSSLVAVLENDVSLSACACELIQFNGTPPEFDLSQDEIGLKYIGPHETVLDSAKAVGGKFIVPSSILYRKSAFDTIGLFDPYYPFSGDFELLIRCVHTSRIGLLGRPLLFYRTHSNNYSKQYATGLHETRLLCQRLSLLASSRHEKTNWSVFRRYVGATNEVFSYQAFDAARMCFSKRQYGEVVWHLFASLRLSHIPLLTALVSRFRYK